MTAVMLGGLMALLAAVVVGLPLRWAAVGVARRRRRRRALDRLARSFVEALERGNACAVDLYAGAWFGLARQDVHRP